ARAYPRDGEYVANRAEVAAAYAEYDNSNASLLPWLGIDGSQIVAGLTSSPALRLGIPTECCVDLQQLFGGFLLQRDCPGEEAWFLPRRTPAVGSLTRFEPQPGNSPRSHVLSASVTSGMPCRRLPWLSAATPL